MAQAVSKAAQSFGVGKQAADQFGQSVANAAKSVGKAASDVVGEVGKMGPLSARCSVHGRRCENQYGRDVGVGQDWFSGIGDIARDTMDGMATNVERGFQKWERPPMVGRQDSVRNCLGMGRRLVTRRGHGQDVAPRNRCLGQDGFGTKQGLNKMNGSMQSGMNKFSGLASAGADKAANGVKQAWTRPATPFSRA